MYCCSSAVMVSGDGCCPTSRPAQLGVCVWFSRVGALVHLVHHLWSTFEVGAHVAVVQHCVGLAHHAARSRCKHTTSTVGDTILKSQVETLSLDTRLVTHYCNTPGG